MLDDSVGTQRDENGAFFFVRTYSDQIVSSKQWP